MLELPIYIRQILAFTASLTLALPLNFKLIMDLVVIMHANFSEWDYNLIPGDVRVGQSYVMKALGNVTDVFLSKHSIMTSNLKKAKVI
jgi:hypothetical protein